MTTEAPAPTPAPAAASVDRARGGDDLRGDLAMVARGSVLNLFGVLTSTLLSLLLVLIVARGFDATTNGLFFEAVALFSLLTTMAQWGAETGMVRMIPRLRVQHRVGDIKHAVRSGLVPVIGVGAVLGLAVFIWAEPLGRLLTNGRHGEELAPVLRALSPFIAIGAGYTVALATTRGFGTMTPTVLIDKIGRAAAQPALALVVVAAGWSATALAVAWASPMLFGLVAALLCTAVLFARSQRDAMNAPSQSRTYRKTFAEFWRFTAPRGLAGVFAVSILWLDTLLLGTMRTTQEAGIYAAATRFLAVGQFIGLAIVQVVAPKLSELLSLDERDRARSVYATSTTWLILAAWPLYLTMILMAPALLGIFGERFLAAQDAVVILGGAMLVATAVGPVDMVLLMAGKSSWNLINTAVAVVVNVALNLILIPPFGMKGAATAWAASILVNNLLPLIEVRRFVGILPFSRGWLTAVLVSVGSFGLVEVIIRVWFGSDVTSLVAAGVIGGIVFIVLVAATRRQLDLKAFRDAARRRR